MTRENEIEELANLLVQEYFDCDQAPLEAAKRIIKAGYSKSNRLVAINEEELQIARETVGYLLSKAKELRHINENQNGMFKERAEIIQKLIDGSTFGSPSRVKELEEAVKLSLKELKITLHHCIEKEDKFCVQNAIDICEQALYGKEKK